MAVDSFVLRLASGSAQKDPGDKTDVFKDCLIQVVVDLSFHNPDRAVARVLDDFA